MVLSLNAIHARTFGPRRAWVVGRPLAILTNRGGTPNKMAGFVSRTRKLVSSFTSAQNASGDVMQYIVGVLLLVAFASLGTALILYLMM
jgi:hypothetical protein